MDPGLLPTLGLGFLFGLQHATDPDHVVAVATIVSRTRRFHAGALIGAFWGVGHTAIMMVMGMAIIVFNVTVTPSVGLSLELCVAVMLLVLGIFRIVRFIQDRDDEESTPVSAPAGFRSVLGAVGKGQAARSMAVGLVHGLAGSAAVTLLVLSTVKSSYAAAAYLLLFGLGTIVGMTAITALLSLPFRVPLLTLNRGLAVGTGVGSFVFGLSLFVQIGFVDGLFLRH